MVTHEVERKASEMIKPTVEVDNDGCKRWFLNGELHRVDGPAVEHPHDVYKAWYMNNKRHRVGGPAIEYKNGDKEWWINGKRHREDGPAIERAGGKVEYYFNDNNFSIDLLIRIFIARANVLVWLPDVLVIDGFEFRS